MYKFYLRVYIKFIRFARSRKWLNEPKRKYTYNGNTFSFYKWPTHASAQGRLFCKPEEMMDSVHFWKTIDRMSSRIMIPERNERHNISC